MIKEVYFKQNDWNTNDVVLVPFQIPGGRWINACVVVDSAKHKVWVNFCNLGLNCKIPCKKEWDQVSVLKISRKDQYRVKVSKITNWFNLYDIWVDKFEPLLKQAVDEKLTPKYRESSDPVVVGTKRKRGIEPHVRVVKRQATPPIRRVAGRKMPSIGYLLAVLAIIGAYTVYHWQTATAPLDGMSLPGGPAICPRPLGWPIAPNS